MRFTPVADREAIAAMLRWEELTGDASLAWEWYQGMKTAAGALSSSPRRLPVRARESRLLRRETRHLLYKRSADSTTGYYLYYFVDDETEDGPRVTVFHLRHASRRPLSGKEARQFR